MSTHNLSFLWRNDKNLLLIIVKYPLKSAKFVKIKVTMAYLTSLIPSLLEFISDFKYILIFFYKALAIFLLKSFNRCKSK